LIERHGQRFRRTFEAVGRRLLEAGCRLPSPPEGTADGRAGGEGTSLVCSSWLAHAYVPPGRLDPAVALLERHVSVRYDLAPLALVNTAFNLLRAGGPAKQRANHEAVPSAEKSPVQTEAAEAERD